MAFWAFLGLQVLLFVRYVSAGYPLGAFHESSFLRGCVFEFFDIHLNEGLVVLFGRGSMYRKSHGVD